MLIYFVVCCSDSIIYWKSVLSYIVSSQRASVDRWVITASITRTPYINAIKMYKALNTLYFKCVIKWVIPVIDIGFEHANHTVID